MTRGSWIARAGWSASASSAQLPAARKHKHGGNYLLLWPRGGVCSDPTFDPAPRPLLAGGDRVPRAASWLARRVELRGLPHQRAVRADGRPLHGHGAVSIGRSEGGRGRLDGRRRELTRAAMLQGASDPRAPGRAQPRVQRGRRAARGRCRVQHGPPPRLPAARALPRHRPPPPR